MLQKKKIQLHKKKKKSMKCLSYYTMTQVTLKYKVGFSSLDSRRIPI